MTDKPIFSIWLPLPPSDNRLYRTGPYFADPFSRYATTAYRDWLAICAPKLEAAIADQLGQSVQVADRPVSRAEYRAFCEATGREVPPSLYGWADSDPVTNVSALDADAYCKWAGVRLPTDDELVAAIKDKHIGPRSVWEWTSTMDGALRVLRGGWWNNTALDLRAAYGFRNYPVYRGHYLGFRVVHKERRS